LSWKTPCLENVFGTLSVLQAALPLLRRQGGGHILTLSSIGGVVSFPTAGSYVASKFAVEALTEVLAGEVASFGIKVTIIEPGSFTTSFRSSFTSAPSMAEYEAARMAVYASFKPEMSGDPAATAAAILKVVDADEPPLRLLLGSHPLPLIRQVYAKRLETWEKWAEVSNAAQGDRGALAAPQDYAQIHSTVNGGVQCGNRQSSGDHRESYRYRKRDHRVRSEKGAAREWTQGRLYWAQVRRLPGGHFQP
jgi:hypothetical protein